MTLSIAIEILQDLFGPSVIIESIIAPKRTVIKIKVPSSERKSYMDKLEWDLGKDFYPIRKERSQYSKTVGHIQVDGFYFVFKPITGASEDLHINASKMASSGKEEVFSFFGKEDIECYTFTNAEDLATSIMDELWRNPKVSNNIYYTFVEYFHNTIKGSIGNKINWHEEILPTEKNELGKYLGELLIGFISLNGNFLNFYNSKPIKFIVPKSSCFSGVDCAIMLKDKSILPISNKYGVGASASFFSNILPIAIANKSKLNKNTVLSRLIAIAEYYGTDFDKKAKDIVYDYATIWKLDLPGITGIDIYRNLVSKKYTKNAYLIIQKIRELNDHDKVEKYLNIQSGYSSVTGWMTRTLAADLMACPKSMQFMLDILEKKNFWQANLNESDWHKGIITYKMTPTSGTLDLKIYGDKSSLSDITAKNGLVTYTIKPKCLPPNQNI